MSASGFVDLQVNGWAGVDFCDPALSPQDVLSASERLRRRGTLAFLPTVVTASPATYARVLPALAEAVESDPRSLPGIHLEGPYISPQDGARGAHPAQYVRPPDLAEFRQLCRLARGHVRLVTLAPELPGALELIQAAQDEGALVSIGHTLADGEQVRAAVEAGARFSTHLGNGCPNLIHRHRNPLWPQIAEPRLAALLISDGHHLPAEFLRTVLLAKGAARAAVTSDASPAGGLPPGDYTFFGARARLEPSGRLRSLEGDTLAGSSACLFDCMNHLASLGMLSETELWQVGRDNPLAWLGLSLGDLPQGGTGPVRFDGQKFFLQNDISRTDQV